LIGIYLNSSGGGSNFHTIILKKYREKETYIMALGYAGGGVYEEFFGKFIVEGDGIEIGKFSDSIGPYDWKNQVKISYEDWEEKVDINELWTELDDSESKVRDTMFSELQDFIYYGEEAENLDSSLPILKENFDSSLTYESDGVYVNEEWELDWMHITQNPNIWYLSLRFDD
jgi:hypothetical protein|tara:strand:- start:820 stop:1335 length:516 start_codon:yes stop_codon:yes gene_type:complete